MCSPVTCIMCERTQTIMWHALFMMHSRGVHIILRVQHNWCGEQCVVRSLWSGRATDAVCLYAAVEYSRDLWNPIEKICIQAQISPTKKHTPLPTECVFFFWFVSAFVPWWFFCVSQISQPEIARYFSIPSSGAKKKNREQRVRELNSTNGGNKKKAPAHFGAHAWKHSQRKWTILHVSCRCDEPN